MCSHFCVCMFKHFFHIMLAYSVRHLNCYVATMDTLFQAEIIRWILSTNNNQVLKNVGWFFYSYNVHPTLFN